MSKKIERINELITILKKRGGATTKELAKILNVSEMTVRRDLNILESRKIVTNVYGAAIYNPSNTTDNLNDNYSLTNAKTTNDSTKSRIGRYAASLIEEGDCIIIDTGSTTEKLAYNIDVNLNITVLCYNINILNRLSDRKNIKLLFAGGYYHPNTQMFESAEGISMIKRIRATKVFVSAAGIHEKLGVTCAMDYEVPTKNAVMNSAVTKILLADSSKFGEIKSSYFAGLSEFQMIVTDAGLSEGWIHYLTKLGIELVTV